MHRDLRDYDTISQFVEAVKTNREALVALDESALSGDEKQMAMVREAFDQLKYNRLPTA